MYNIRTLLKVNSGKLMRIVLELAVFYFVFIKLSKLFGG